MDFVILQCNIPELNSVFPLFSVYYELIGTLDMCDKKILYSSFAGSTREIRASRKASV